MKEIKIFLFDLDPTSGIGKELREILDPIPNFTILLPHEPIQGNESISDHENLFTTTSVDNADIIILVLSRNQFKQPKGLFQSINKEPPSLPMIAVMDTCHPEDIFLLLKLGIEDFIIPPFKAIDILPRLWRLLSQSQQQEQINRHLKERLGLRQLVGESPVFLDVVDKIPIIAKFDTSVLISGETGTGKEMFARAIHYLSPRADKPFIPFNCGAIPSDLMENELFGHAQGAFMNGKYFNSSTLLKRSLCLKKHYIRLNRQQ